MDFNAKEAAQQLLKIADAIEKEAYDKTMFVCAECKHSSSLASINETRQKVANEKGIESVNPITVNDSVYCPSCSGKMSYEASEESEKYYVDVDAADDDMFDLDFGDSGEDKEEDKKTTDETSEEEDKGDDNADNTDRDDVFEPVDEQEEKKKEEEGEEDSEIDLDLGGEPSDESTDAEPVGAPSDDPTKDDEDTSIVEEEVKEAPKKKKKKDNPADGEVAFPKKEKPKFEKMPKEASERFLASVKKYSV